MSTEIGEEAHTHAQKHAHTHAHTHTHTHTRTCAHTHTHTHNHAHTLSWRDTLCSTKSLKYVQIEYRTVVFLFGLFNITIVPSIFSCEYYLPNSSILEKELLGVVITQVSSF